MESWDILCSKVTLTALNFLLFWLNAIIKITCENIREGLVSTHMNTEKKTSLTFPIFFSSNKTTKFNCLWCWNIKQILFIDKLGWRWKRNSYRRIVLSRKKMYWESEHMTGWLDWTQPEGTQSSILINISDALLISFNFSARNTINS